MIADRQENTIEQNNGSSILRLENVDKYFSAVSGKRVSVLRDINLTVQAGELVTIIGSTGSGKTTLLNLIAGLIEPDTGHITFSQEIGSTKDMAYVFQHYTLLPWRTVLKNVAFGLQLRKIPKQQRNKFAMELIQQVGLAGFENAYPHELSGGMRQRTAVAQALATKPKLLLMDEPFGSLDDATRTELQHMLTRLQQQRKTTILFITHNIDEAIFLADRILVLAQSPAVIREDITVDMERPRNRTSKQFSELYMQIRNIMT